MVQHVWTVFCDSEVDPLPGAESFLPQLYVQHWIEGQIIVEG